MSGTSLHRVGETIAGRYRLISTLGQGGHGVAYRAWDEHSGVPVVLKMPLAKHLIKPVVIERFGREIARLRQCTHSHIVPIIDDGSDDQGRPFLVMRFLPGGSLAHRKKPLTPSVLHRWLPTVAAALDYIHSRGVLHRDVKPSNIFFNTQSKAFLGDFGIARLAEEQYGTDVRVATSHRLGPVADQDSEESLTATGQLMGTVPYTAPELFEECPRITPQADQYSLAVSVYEMTSNFWPVDQRGTEAFRKFHRSPQQPPSLSTRMQNMPSSLVSAVDKALRKKPEDRFATCAEFAAAALSDVLFTPVDPSQHRFLCPGCGRLVRVPINFIGRSCRCPNCHVALQVSRDLSALWKRDEAPPENPARPSRPATVNLSTAEAEHSHETLIGPDWRAFPGGESTSNDWAGSPAAPQCVNVGAEMYSQEGLAPSVSRALACASNAATARTNGAAARGSESPVGCRFILVTAATVLGIHWLLVQFSANANVAKRDFLVYILSVDLPVIVFIPIVFSTLFSDWMASRRPFSEWLGTFVFGRRPSTIPLYVPTTVTVAMGTVACLAWKWPIEGDENGEFADVILALCLVVLGISLPLACFLGAKKWFHKKYP